MDTLPGLVVIAGFLAVVGGLGVLMRYAHAVPKSRRAFTNVVSGVGAACVYVGMTRRDPDELAAALFVAVAACLYVLLRLFTHAADHQERAA